MENFLYEALIYLGAAVLVVPLSVRLGLGSVIGYLVAGILMGPVFGLVGADTKDLQHVAEFGVVIMLFLIGLELEPRALWDMRHRLLGLGGAQVLGTTLLIALLLMAFGTSFGVALTAGMIGSLSSTAIVLQTLTEKNLMRTTGGRSIFSVLLMQDIAVVPMLAIIPLVTLAGISGPTSDTFGVVNPEVATEVDGAAEPIITLIQTLPGWAAALLTLALVGAIVLGGNYLSRPIFRFVHAARLPEMSTFIALLSVLGAAFLMMIVGLSPALGTFVAGVVLAGSEFRHQLEAELKPFKGLLLGLFFITVGMGINFSVLAREPLLVIGLTFGLIAIKMLVLLALSVVFKIKGRDRWLFAVALAQGGEFGFLLVSFARSSGAIAVGPGQLALLVISLSMLLAPLMFLAYERIMVKIGAGRAQVASDAIDEQGQIIIAGVGRFGQVVHRMVRSTGKKAVVLDNDLAIIAQLRTFGVKGFYGDPSRPELLQSAGLMSADVLVVAVNDPEVATQIVRYARSVRQDLHIIARARDRVHVYELYQAGADDTVRETFDSAVRAGRYVMENIGYSEYEAAKLSQTFWRIDRQSMRSLAEVWVPGMPVDQNEAYVHLARELEREMEEAITGELYEVRPMEALAGMVEDESEGDQPAETPASAKVSMPE
jgi:CPA2 family monovalent cation:H+ antiporter-2